MTTRDLITGSFWSYEYVVVTSKDGRLKFEGKASEARAFVVRHLGVTFEVKVLTVEGDVTRLPDVRVYMSLIKAESADEPSNGWTEVVGCVQGQIRSLVFRKA